MGLLKCPDCGNAVSDQAPSCPKCGRPRFTAGATSQAPLMTSAIAARHQVHPVALALALVLVAMVGWGSWNAYRRSQLPPLPMVVLSRPAIIGGGLVIVFQNESDLPLSVAATLAHPATNLQRMYQIDTRPHGSKSIGTIEGWTGQTGDTITLVNNNYQSWSGSIR
jgi:hypothetical protein